MALDGVPLYFPDKYPKGRQIDREFMFNVVNTLHEKVVQEVIEYAHEQRHSINAKNERNEAIMMSEHW